MADAPLPFVGHIRKTDRGYCGILIGQNEFAFDAARYAARNYDPRLQGPYFDPTRKLHACKECCDRVNEEIEKERTKGFIDYSTSIPR